MGVAQCTKALADPTQRPGRLRTLGDTLHTDRKTPLTCSPVSNLLHPGRKARPDLPERLVKNPDARLGHPGRPAQPTEQAIGVGVTPIGIAGERLLDHRSHCAR
jgi:hypothetical protein